MKRGAALVVLLLVAAGCGAGASTPKEGVGLFMTRILREEINGQ